MIAICTFYIGLGLGYALACLLRAASDRDHSAPVTKQEPRRATIVHEARSPYRNGGLS